MPINIHLFHLTRPPGLFFFLCSAPWELIPANSLMPASGWVWSRHQQVTEGWEKKTGRDHRLSLPCPFSISVSMAAALALSDYSLGQHDSYTAPAPAGILWQDFLPDSSLAAGLLIAPHCYIPGCLTIPICMLHPDNSSLSNLFSEVFSFEPNPASYQDSHSHNIPCGTCSQTLFTCQGLSSPYCPHVGGPP